MYVVFLWKLNIANDTANLLKLMKFPPYELACAHVLNTLPAMYAGKLSHIKHKAFVIVKTSLHSVHKLRESNLSNQVYTD